MRIEPGLRRREAFPSFQRRFQHDLLPLGVKRRSLKLFEFFEEGLNELSDLAIAIIAGFNWLNHCAVLAAADREKFSGTLTNFRKVTVLAQQWWAMAGADERCGQMLAQHEKPPLMLYLIWTEYTRLAKEVASAALFGSSIERAIAGQREVLEAEFAGRPGEFHSALDELTQTMASFESARDPDDLIG